MRAQLDSRDVAISELQGKLTVTILDQIMFDSGEAEVKPAGQAMIAKNRGGFLAQHPALKIHVIGHTDNVPIRANARSRFASNWELSTARALAAVRFLTEETAGVLDPRRVGAVGYGEFRPAWPTTPAPRKAAPPRTAASPSPSLPMNSPGPTPLRCSRRTCPRTSRQLCRRRTILRPGCSDSTNYRQLSLKNNATRHRKNIFYTVWPIQAPFPLLKAFPYAILPAVNAQTLA